MKIKTLKIHADSEIRIKTLTKPNEHPKIIIKLITHIIRSKKNSHLP